MNLQSALVDVALIAAVVAIAYLKLLPPEVAQPLLIATISGVLAAKAALAKPPGSGGGEPPAAGGALGGSAVGSIILGLLTVFRR